MWNVSILSLGQSLAKLNKVLCAQSNKQDIGSESWTTQIWIYIYIYIYIHSFIHSFPLACAEFNDSLPFSGASSIPLRYVLFPASLLHQLFFHPLSPHLATYFLVYLSILLFPKFIYNTLWEFYFLPFSVHVQTNVIYLTLLSL